MWQIWPGQLYPASAAQEAQFHADLAAAAARPSRFTRDDVVALMTMLRCGTALGEAFEFAPGLQRRSGALLAAYRKVDSLRVQSVHAWESICADPTPAVLRKEYASAAVLFPVAIERLATNPDDDDRSLALSVRHAELRVTQIEEMVAGLEARLMSLPPTFPQAGALASALYAPTAPCLYADPYFVPTRVSVLSPTRVADLLGEARR